MAKRPKFDSIYQGPWPYSPVAGVGLKFTGKPINREWFATIVAQYGCAERVANRIYNELAEGKSSYTTVIPTLDFDEIASYIAALGTTMEIVPPGSSYLTIHGELL